MTDLRKAAQEALEKAEYFRNSATIEAEIIRQLSASLRAALAAPEPAPPLDALRALPEKWRNREKDWHDAEGPIMRVAYDACADELTALIDAAQPKERHSK